MVIVNMDVFGERLSQMMEQRNVSATELADALNVNKATIYHYKNADFKTIKYTAVKAIADYLGVSLEYLTGASDSMYQEAQEPPIDITDDEKVVLDLFRNIPIEHRQAAIEQFAVYAVRIALKLDQ